MLLGLDHHVHLDDPDIQPEALLRELRALNGWQGALTAGYGPERFAHSRWLCAQEPRIVRSVGLHPYWLAEHAHDPDRLEAGWQGLLSELDQPGVIALGETGLDRTRRDLIPLEAQLQWLERQLKLAADCRLPLVLHLVGLHGHALPVLQRFAPLQGAVHRFSGSREVAAAYQALGLHVSLSLEPRVDANKRAALARSIAADRLLLETDWPFLNHTYPEALQLLQDLLAEVALARGVAPAALAAQLADNARAAYRWAPPAAA